MRAAADSEFGDWLLRHGLKVVTALVVLMVVAIGLGIFTLVRELGTEQRLGDVRVVGPCRTYGPDDPECRQQSRLIFEACSREPGCPDKILDRLRRVTAAPAEAEERGEGAGADTSAGASARGDQAPTSTSPGSSAAPPGTSGSPAGVGGGGGGSGGSPGGAGPGGSGPSPSPPASPPADNSLLGPALDGLNEGLDNACDQVPPVAQIHVC